jgi:DNA-binding NtrC family response regulator
MPHPLIAVVDDEQDLLDNFRDLLEDQFQVVSFSSPREFLKALPNLQTQGLRLIVSDYKMPGMTGLEMIQKAHPQVPHLPFIILSGFLDKKTVIEAVELGVFRLLEKPCPPETLLESVDQLILESELFFIRQEIRQITSQLRELYTTARFALLQHIPDDLMDRLVIDAAPEGEVKKKMSFEELLENLELRLDQLLTSEKAINELKGNRKE